MTIWICNAFLKFVTKFDVGFFFFFFFFGSERLFGFVEVFFQKVVQNALGAGDYSSNF